MTVAITGSRRASELAHLITSHGGRPYLAPTVGIRADENTAKGAKAFIESILAGDVDYAVFMTGPGVYSLMRIAQGLKLEARLVDVLKRSIIVARSSKPKAALANYGVKTDIIPDENTAEGIAQTLKARSIQGKKIAILWHGSYSPLLKKELENAGAQIFESSSYAYSLELEESAAEILQKMGFNYAPPDETKTLKLIQDSAAGLVHVITFTSPPSVRSLFKIAESHGLKEELQSSLNRKAIVVAVGPSTKKSLEENGVKVHVTPEVYKMGPMVAALVDYVTRVTPNQR